MPVSTIEISPLARILAPINPSTTRTAKRSGAPGPVVTRAATHSATSPDAMHRTSRAVEPAGMITQVEGPERKHCHEPIKPPAATAAAPR